MRITKQSLRNTKTSTFVYIILRVLVVGIMVRAIYLRRWDQVLYCSLALIEFMIPSFVERRLKIELPSTLEIIVLLFIFAGEIMGEIGQFYHKIQAWDLILHTINGFLMGAIGVALIDVFNKHPSINFSLSPFFVAFVAFCFSITIGVLWEFTEYTADRLLGVDMQKDTIVSYINSEETTIDGVRTPLRIEGITTTTITGYIQGKPEEIVLDGYLDVGINDTMEDMFVNLVGAFIFSVLAAFYIKGRGEGAGHFAGAFIPRMLTEDELLEFQSKKSVEKSKIHAHIKS